MSRLRRRRSAPARCSRNRWRPTQPSSSASSRKPRSRAPQPETDKLGGVRQMMMRRRPLLRAAMVGGGAYAAGKARQRGQQQQADEEQRIAALEQQSAAPAPAPAAAPSGSGDVVGKLKELKELQDSGALTAEEFELAKQKLL